MPPPSVIPSDAANVSKSPVRENLSPPHSEFKNPKATDYDNANVSPMIRTTSKSTQNKFIRTQKSSYTDGLETGSDSDVMEDTGNTHARSFKYSPYPTRVSNYDSRVHDRSGIQLDYDQTSKTRPFINVMDNKTYDVSSLKPNISSLQSSKEDVSGRDHNVRDLLRNYETPFLSEFTRNLSSRSLINTSASPTSSLKSKHIHDKT